MKNKLRISVLLVLITMFAFGLLLKSNPTEAKEPQVVSNLFGTLEEIYTEDIQSPNNTSHEFYLRTSDGKRLRLFATNEKDLYKNKKIVIKNGIMTDTEIHGEATSLQLEIEAIPDIVPYNGTSSIRWDVQEATSCIGTNGSTGWAGTKDINGGEFSTTSLTQNTTFTITCENTFDSITKSVTVTVASPNVNTYIHNVTTNYYPENSTPEPYKLAVFLVNTEGEDIPFTVNQAEELIWNGQIQRFIKEASYGKKYIDGDIFGWIEADITTNSTECNTGFLPFLEDNSSFNIDEVVEYINTNSINLASYKHIVFVMNCKNLGGVSTTGTMTQTFNNEDYEFSRTKVNIDLNASFDQRSNSIEYPHQFAWTNFDDVFSHEIMHAFGSRHAGGLDCGVEELGENCTEIEYGNPYDIMGGGNFSLHPNAAIKKLLNWIEYPQLLNITSSGTYRINMLEYSNGFQAAKIKNPTFVDDNIEYFVERRVGSGFDRTLNYLGLAPNQNGLFLNRYDRDANTFSTSFLVDTTASIDGWYSDVEDATIRGNATFTDTERGIIIGPIISAGDTGISFNVQILPASSCIRSNPTITTTSPYTYDLSEPVRDIRLQVTNNDSLECGNSTFLVKAIALSSGMDDLPDKVQLIQPQAQRNISWINAIPTTTPPGTYTYRIVAKNTEYPGYGSSQIITVNVIE